MCNLNSHIRVLSCEKTKKKKELAKIGNNNCFEIDNTYES